MKMELTTAFRVRFVVKILRKREETIMARHGENIRKRKDGRWEGRYQVYDESRGKLVYRSIYGRTYKEVKEKLAVHRNCLEKLVKTEKTDTISENPDVTAQILFSDAAEEWLIKVKDTKKHSTYVKYSIIYRTYLEKQLQNANLHNITDLLVKEVFSGHFSDSTQKSIRCVLNQILKFASQKYFIPVPNLQIQLTSEKRRSVEVFTRGEQARLLSVIYREMDISKMAVLMCLYTGLRLGELCSLKWSDIDFVNRLVKVNSTVQRLYTEGCHTKTILMESVPKSECSRREIPLPAEVLELLVSFQDNGEYVFGGNKPMEPRTLQNHFKRITRESGLPEKNFHMLRHTFATNCIEEGIDVKSLSEILGHSDVQITLNRYVHPSMDTKRKHLNALSLFYGQIYGQVK